MLQDIVEVIGWVAIWSSLVWALCWLCAYVLKKSQQDRSDREHTGHRLSSLEAKAEEHQLWRDEHARWRSSFLTMLGRITSLETYVKQRWAELEAHVLRQDRRHAECDKQFEKHHEQLEDHIKIANKQRELADKRHGDVSGRIDDVVERLTVIEGRIGRKSEVR